MTGSQSSTTAFIVHIFCLDARYQSVTTGAESARRVDETPNHFAQIPLLPGINSCQALEISPMHTAMSQRESIRVYSMNLSCYLYSIKHNILIIVKQHIYLSALTHKRMVLLKYLKILMQV